MLTKQKLRVSRELRRFEWGVAAPHPTHEGHVCLARGLPRIFHGRSSDMEGQSAAAGRFGALDRG